MHTSNIFFVIRLHQFFSEDFVTGLMPSKPKKLLELTISAPIEDVRLNNIVSHISAPVDRNVTECTRSAEADRSYLAGLATLAARVEGISRRFSFCVAARAAILRKILKLISGSRNVRSLGLLE